MEKQRFVVSREGEILEHGSDFDAVGTRLSDFISPATWPILEATLKRVGESGESETCICAVEGSWQTMGVLLLVSPLGKDRFSVLAREAIEVPIDLVLNQLYRVMLMRPGERHATIECETTEKAEAVAWLDEWLDEPVGLVPAVIPPRSG